MTIRRPCVFISSTSADVLNARNAAKAACMDAGAIPLDPPFFDPDDVLALQTRYQVVRRADAFIGIYGFLAGDDPPEVAQYITEAGEVRFAEPGRSLLWHDFAWAQAAALPMLFFWRMRTYGIPRRYRGEPFHLMKRYQQWMRELRAAYPLHLYQELDEIRPLARELVRGVAGEVPPVGPPSGL